MPMTQERNTTSHTMPFGTELLPDGKTRFRFWAPTAQHVALCLESDESVLPGVSSDDGWYEWTLPNAPAGTLYKFQVDEGLRVPDPASRFQPQDAHGPSQVVAPQAYHWQCADWKGRPWEETILYELHVGTFTPEGTYKAIESRLDYLIDLGITAIELMPLSDFPGQRNWGYDGVLHYAPDSAYGTPDELKHLIDLAHQKGLMVFLDVVYNHFGPEGNYLHCYAKSFFNSRHKTPWGPSINYDGKKNRVVRDFVIHNALYWLEEFQFDGLRFDAVHAIIDDSPRHILHELAAEVRAKFGDRNIHLVLENDDNAVRFIGNVPQLEEQTAYNAQWDDDAHHALHVLASKESDGYYIDYADNPAQRLVRCLTEGFAYQGDASAFREGEHRGEVSRHLPPTSFVAFIQNHDQIGNRAFGDRLHQYSPLDAVRAAATVYLLAPWIPLLYMGEEWAASSPFLFFCDFGPDLAKAVTKGRRSEFAKFAQFRDPKVRESIPDPGSLLTFERSFLLWNELEQGEHREFHQFYRSLLHCRKERIWPLIRGLTASVSTKASVLSPYAFTVEWSFDEDQALVLMANFDDKEVPVSPTDYALLFESRAGVWDTMNTTGLLSSHAALWFHR